MKAFPGCVRRVFIRLPKGSRVHLRRRHNSGRPSVTTWCGHQGGEEIGWRDAKGLELCGVCRRASGLGEQSAA